MCRIQASEVNEFVHMVTNCNAIQAEFVCPAEFAANQLSEGGRLLYQIHDKNFLLHEVLRDRYVMFKKEATHGDNEEAENKVAETQENNEE